MDDKDLDAIREIVFKAADEGVHKALNGINEKIDAVQASVNLLAQEMGTVKDDVGVVKAAVQTISEKLLANEEQPCLEPHTTVAGEGEPGPVPPMAPPPAGTRAP